MDDIRAQILREQQLRKARLANHFNEAFENSEELAEENETEEADNKDKKPLKKAMTIDSVDDAFDILNKAGEDDLFEKAHQVGDMHPNGKWVWTQLPNGKFDWRTKGGRAHQRSNASGGNNNTPQGGNGDTKPQSKNASGGKTWDKLSDFNVEGSDEKALWNNWYKFQTMGDPHFMNKMTEIFEKKFPQVAEWHTTTPNTGKSVITAKDENGKDIATLDLAGKTIKLDKLQTFMDKCHESKAVKKTTTKSDDKKNKQYQSFHSTQVADKALKWLNDEDEGMSFLDAFKNGRDVYNDDDKFKKDVSEKLSKLLHNYISNQSEINQYVEQAMGELDHQFKMGKYATKKLTIDEATDTTHDKTKKILTDSGIKNFSRIDLPVGTIVSCIEKNSAGALYAGDKGNEYLKIENNKWIYAKDANKNIRNIWTNDQLAKQLAKEKDKHHIEIKEKSAENTDTKFGDLDKVYKRITNDFDKYNYPSSGFSVTLDSKNNRMVFWDANGNNPTQVKYDKTTYDRLMKHIKENYDVETTDSNRVGAQESYKFNIKKKQDDKKQQRKTAEIKATYSSITGDLNTRQMILDRYPELKKFKNGGNKLEVESVGYDYDEINAFQSKLKKINRDTDNFIYDAVKSDKELNSAVAGWFNYQDQDRARASYLQKYANTSTDELQSELDELGKKDKSGKTKIQRYAEKYKKLLLDDAPKPDRVKCSKAAGQLLYKRAYLTGLIKKRKYIESELKKLK